MQITNNSNGRKVINTVNGTITIEAGQTSPNVNLYLREKAILEASGWFTISGHYTDNPPPTGSLAIDAAGGALSDVTPLALLLRQASAAANGNNPLDLPDLTSQNSLITAPVVTTSASDITSGTVVPLITSSATPAFTAGMAQVAVYGGVPTIIGTTSPRLAAPSVSTLPSVIGSDKGNMEQFIGVSVGITGDMHQLCWAIEFVTTSATIGLPLFTYSAHKFYIQVDGRYINKAGHSTPNGALGLAFCTIAFGSRQARRIKIIMPHVMQIYAGPTFGIKLAQTYDTIWAPDQSQVAKWLVAGDSFTEAFTDAVTTDKPYLDAITSMGYRAVERLGGRHFVNLGLGRTGYVSSGGGARSKLYDQIGRWGPHILGAHGLIICHGYNDYSFASQVYTEALASYRRIRASAPNLPIFVFGPQVGIRNNDATSNAVENAISSAVSEMKRMGDNLIAFRPTVQAVPPYTQGVGYVGATSGAGNSNVKVSEDGVHYNSVGHSEDGMRIPGDVRSMMYEMNQ